MIFELVLATCVKNRWIVWNWFAYVVAIKKQFGVSLTCTWPKKSKRHLQSLAGSRSLKIKVSPEQLDLFRSSRDDILESIDGIRELVFIPDPALELGDVKVEHNEGKIDATIRQQIFKIGEHLTENAIENNEKEGNEPI